MTQRILLVEDDALIRESIVDFFSGKGPDSFTVITAADGTEGLYYIENDVFDLVLLDIMLPGLDGFSLCRELRKKSTAPIIFLTARGREEDVLYGYDLGCDDYIVKPFSLAALYAKCRVMMKRAQGTMNADIIRYGAISWKPSALQFLVDGEEIGLPPKEYAILVMLFKNRGSVVTRELLLTRIWGYDYEGDERVLDNHMRKLRSLLGPAGRQIRTVITKGYKLTGESK